MKKLNIAAACFLALAVSCSPQKEYKLKIKPLTLKKSEIYEYNVVRDVLFDAEEVGLDSLKDKSRDLFLKGVDYYRNKKEFASAVRHFKTSILILPDAKTYYELGNVLLDFRADKEMLEESIKAFRLAENLNFEPKAKISYKIACVYNALRSNFSTSESSYESSMVFHLREVIEKGLMDTNAIKKDPLINSITSTSEYKEMIQRLSSTTIAASSFDLFKKAFPAQTDKFFISANDVEMKDYKESVSYDFVQFVPEMENVSFGRDVSHDFYYVANMGGNENYSAFIYTSESFYGEDMQPVHTVLATYDKEGEIISRKLISCQCSAENVREAAVEGNKIVMKDFKRKWQYPVDEVSFDKNKIKSFELVAEAKYKITEDGKIVVDEIPANYNDSTILAKGTK
ncbi:MAG: hypothetical protein J7604_00650 [Sporocytophaga sp.]|uniref:hypothetical protein n=1 Tax=Sporocytophaga sp. TaxID=2231183 RepID=UPI001B2C0863|nr:hypothetical protein [Sporocytophaga sp.]MBO9698679.1 hypothetical protein [Sporocytophaga sp.]